MICIVIFIMTLQKLLFQFTLVFTIVFAATMPYASMLKEEEDTIAFLLSKFQMMRHANFHNYMIFNI